jgi:hypothetical protein
MLKNLYSLDRSINNNTTKLTSGCVFENIYFNNSRGVFYLHVTVNEVNKNFYFI